MTSGQFDATTRQPERVFFRTLQARFPRGDAIARHAHEEAQLIVAISGTVQLHTHDGRWLLPPQLAIWSPAGVPHSSEVLMDAEVWSVYYDDRECSKLPAFRDRTRPFVLKVTPLLREIIRSLFQTDPLTEKAAHLARTALHEVVEVPDAPTFLPLPIRPLGRRVADLALADHACRMDIAALAEAGATSTRTISRVFAAETGLTFKAWRQRARIVAAMNRLATGDTIAAVSAYVGFNGPTAFAHSFKQVTGESVGNFKASGTRES